MAKELFVSSTPHETKVAMVEDDQLTEVYYERENEYTLAGSIYKGRVTRVLPGMQSAFVDIGLERDAFLYVTDFFEQEEEEGEIEQIAAGRGNGHQQERPHPEARREEAAPAIEEPQTHQAAEGEPDGNRQQRNESEQPQDERRRFGRRHRGRRGRGFPESKYERHAPQASRPAASEPNRAAAPSYQPILLPGESISKYRNLAASAPAPTEISHPAQQEEAVAQEQSSEPVSSAAEEFSNAGQASFEEPVKRPTEEIDAAAILAAHEREQEERSQAARPDFRAEAEARSGVLEEEEIDEEESEAPGAASDFEEDEYDDFEEEMLDQAEEPESPKGDASEIFEEAGELGHSQPEPGNAGEERAAMEEAPELDQGELAESEVEREQLAEEMESEPAEAATRAEVRGPSGYQQRVAFERARRGGRRGGRRGHLRGRKFHRAPLPQISELLKEGQEVLVQIAKEPIGKKGARITSHIALPGRFLVYMPTVNHNGVSRKIASEEERQRLKRIIMSERQNAGDGHHGGFIVRTAAAAANEDDLRADIRFLLNLWTEINSRAEASKPPALIYHDLNLVERTLRDQVSEGFSHIWVDSEQEYERILRFVNRFQPSLTKRVKLYTKETPLFEQFNIQDEINKALKSKVWLKSGGYIVINQTEALVAIDVNTGKYVGKTQKLEDTIVKTNVDAIKEIVRQIRLRDLGGIIVIDFIDMDERRNRQKVMQALEEALKSDRAPSKALQFNDFGLVAITRKRVKQSLERTLGSPCTYCSGTGLIKSVATVCNEIYVEMRKMLRHLERGDVIVRVNPEVAKALKTNNARWLQDMEDLTGKTVIVKPDPTLHQEQFDIH
jgi:ribonuclease G